MDVPAGCFPVRQQGALPGVPEKGVAPADGRGVCRHQVRLRCPSGALRACGLRPFVHGVPGFCLPFPAAEPEGGCVVRRLRLPHGGGERLCRARVGERPLVFAARVRDYVLDWLRVHQDCRRVRAQEEDESGVNGRGMMKRGADAPRFGISGARMRLFVQEKVYISREAFHMEAISFIIFVNKVKILG